MSYIYEVSLNVRRGSPKNEGERGTIGEDGVELQTQETASRTKMVKIPNQKEASLK
jgi:hypothetical protein